MPCGTRPPPSMRVIVGDEARRGVRPVHRPRIVASTILLAWMAACLWPVETRAQNGRTDGYVTNGSVHAMVISGNTLYIGGSFTRVGPATGGAVPLDVLTSQPMALPKVAGTVSAVAPDGSGGW